jgi:hypothetical protein
MLVQIMTVGAKAQIDTHIDYADPEYGLDGK